MRCEELKKGEENETNTRFTEDEDDPEEIQDKMDKEVLEETKKRWMNNTKK